MRRRFHPPTTRDRILTELKRSLRDTVRAGAPIERHCVCDDCRIARAVDISPDARVLLVTSKDYSRMTTLAAGLGWSESQLTDYTLRMFYKAPSLLREREAGAIIAHLEQWPALDNLKNWR